MVSSSTTRQGTPVGSISMSFFMTSSAASSLVNIFVLIIAFPATSARNLVSVKLATFRFCKAVRFVAFAQNLVEDNGHSYIGTRGLPSQREDVRNPKLEPPV